MKPGKYLRKTWGSLSYRWLDKWLPAVEDARRETALPPLEGHVPSGIGAPLLFFAAADAAYFERYGRAFIAALLANAPGSGIHIHLFNPTPAQLQLLAELTGGAVPHFTHSWEHVDLGRHDDERRGRYYYSVRFVRFAEIAAGVGAPCLCLDIDALLVGPIEELKDRIGSADLAFYARFDKHGGNTKLLAGTLYVSSSRQAMAFLRAVGGQIGRFVARGYLLEKLDQMVIYDFFLRFNRKTPRLKFMALDDSIVDLRFGGGGLIWYPKGASKRDRGYCDRLRRFEADFSRRVSHSSGGA